MGRLVWYAGVSAALAGGVVISAFNQRANFYSACVYLAQSNLCLMILINLILFIYGSFMYGLQRLCYGPLRPIEIEQLYEKSWFAITETCLAMTIFREEVGAWFLVMFVALLTGKVWGWIGDGRVEILEQQPPANPRLFHIRLTTSLAMSVLYDLWLMHYTTSTVIQQARPNMMVMFLFEFAVLTTSSFATACRYAISLVEASVVKKQTQERLLERRREVREERAEMIRQREAANATDGQEGNAAEPNTPLPSEDDVDEMDIEVPGWETKGQWVLTLDLITDFVKLGIYITFFVILLVFYGLPIHIMRDLFMTARSFLKRLTAFLRYRRATRDMNQKYEDATVEDIQREDTCIICREEMRPWSVTNPQAPPVAPGDLPPARPAATVNERTRPKKLPCGHILHLGCLKSWLERQQVCPTCRRPVVDNPPNQAAEGAANNQNPAGQGPQRAPGQQDGAGPQVPARGPARGMRMLNLGPLRVGFGQANLQDLQNMGAPQPGQENAGPPRVYGLELGFPRRREPQPLATDTTNPITPTAIPDHLQQIEQQIVAEIRNLQVTQQELQLVTLLQAELDRLRTIQNGGPDRLAANFPISSMPQLGFLGRRTAPAISANVPQMQQYGAPSTTAAIPAGSADLPPGVTIPDGWSLLPLQRLDSVAGVSQAGSVSGPAANPILAPTATTQPVVSPMISGTSNNILTPTPTTNPENQSRASSVHSSDTNPIHTPVPTTVNQTNSTSPDTITPTSNSARTPNPPPSSNAQGEPSGLPNWGPPRLFSAGRRISTTNDQNSSSTLPQSSPSSANKPSTSAVSAIDASLSSAPSHEGEGKGKAKAVTMEDAEDEAEDS